MTNTGTFTDVDGRPAVRFERTYPHPIDRVWALVSEPDELRHWFPMRVELALRVGAPMRFYDDPNLPAGMKGQVLAVEPPRLLAFAWGDDELRFDLEPLGADRTRFTLTNFIGEPNTAARTAGGWEICLRSMDVHLGVDPVAPDDWRAIYQAYVEAGMPSGAPVPGDPEFGV